MKFQVNLIPLVLTIKSYSKIYLIEKLVSAVLMPEFTDAE